MSIWLVALVAGILVIMGARIGYLRWRQRRIAARRIVEKPNSFYSSALVKHQEDRERWRKVDLEKIHPVNREEVERLLALADVRGPDALTTRERLFLETITELSFG